MCCLSQFYKTFGIIAIETIYAPIRQRLRKGLSEVYNLIEQNNHPISSKQKDFKRKSFYTINIHISVQHQTQTTRYLSEKYIIKSRVRVIFLQPQEYEKILYLLKYIYLEVEFRYLF